MLYTVEIRRIGGDLLSLMSQMRTWLDHQRFEPDAFRYSVGSPATAFRLDFKNEQAAIAFAKAFGGRILGSFDYAVPAPTNRETAGAFGSTPQWDARRPDSAGAIHSTYRVAGRRSA